jgi:hypothetical protein
MDTNILTHPDIDPDNIALSARLPGELPGVPHDDGIQNEHPAPEAGERLPRSRRTKSKRRGMLLAGVAAAAVVAVGAGVFLLSPFNHFYPLPRLASTVRNAATSAGVKLPAVLAPSASLANVTLPPAAPPATRDHYAAKPREDEVAELLALHPAAKDHPATAIPKVAAPLIIPPTAAQPEKAPANPPTAIVAAASLAPSDPPAGYVPSEPGATASRSAHETQPPQYSPPFRHPGTPRASPHRQCPRYRRRQQSLRSPHRSRLLWQRHRRPTRSPLHTISVPRRWRRKIRSRCSVW